MGERFIEWCKANSLIVTNTWFKKNNPKRRWTWRSPGGTCKNQIDNITINERFRNSITQSKSYPGADCNSDHLPVICNIKTKLRKLKKNNINAKLDLDKLRTSPAIQENYIIEVRNRFDVLSLNEDTTTWNNFRDSLVESAKEIIPKMPKRSKNKWMTDEILNLRRERQAISERE